MQVHLENVQLKFVYQGHQVKVIRSRSRSQEQKSVSDGAYPVCGCLSRKERKFICTKCS